MSSHDNLNSSSPAEAKLDKDGQEKIQIRPLRRSSTSGRRKLTPFLAQEMLYDYATDQLDSERKAAVEEFVSQNEATKSLLDGIHRSLDYTSQLAKIEISPEILNQLSESENVISLGKRYSSWTEWPETLRWSLIAILVSSSVAGLVSIVPWNRFAFHRTAPSDTIEIAQIQLPADESKANEGQEAAEGSNASGDEGSGDDVPDSPIQIDPKQPQLNDQKLAASNAQAENAARENSGDDHHDHPTAVQPPPPVQPQAKVKGAPPSQQPIVIMAPTSGAAGSTGVAGSAPSADVQTSPDAESGAKREGKPRGFVYRAFMNLSDLETLGPRITEQVRELGAEKAGEVELGWKRGNGRYYHFTLPESNEKQLLEKLQAYGPVRISKDPHPRIMPEGQVRFILWIDAAN